MRSRARPGSSPGPDVAKSHMTGTAATAIEPDRHHELPGVVQVPAGSGGDRERADRRRRARAAPRSTRGPSTRPRVALPATRTPSHSALGVGLDALAGVEHGTVTGQHLVHDPEVDERVLVGPAVDPPADPDHDGAGSERQPPTERDGSATARRRPPAVGRRRSPSLVDLRDLAQDPPACPCRCGRVEVPPVGSWSVAVDELRGRAVPSGQSWDARSMIVTWSGWRFANRRSMDRSRR